MTHIASDAPSKSPDRMSVSGLSFVWSGLRGSNPVGGLEGHCLTTRPSPQKCKNPPAVRVAGFYYVY